MKFLKAEKLKNCWSIEIIDRQIAFTLSDVLKLIRQNGLQIRNKNHKLDKKGESTDEVKGIYAD